jgi:hypothetical protein
MSSRRGLGRTVELDAEAQERSRIGSIGDEFY